MPSVVVVGIGVVGARTVRQLHASSFNVFAATNRPDDALDRCGLLESAPVRVVQRQVLPTVDIAVLATPGRSQVDLARRYLAKRSHVIAINDDLTSCRELLALDGLARANSRALIVGAGFAPGLSCALAALAAERFVAVTELHVAKHGTAGPSCARQHHRALRSLAEDYRDGDLLRRPGGSGRELVYFPAPIEGADCYRAELPDPLLLRRTFPHITRVTSRVAAHRRDRLTSFLPTLLPPHAEGGTGAVRVEARGRLLDGMPGTVVFGASARPGDGAAATAAAIVDHVVDTPPEPGAVGVAGLARPGPLLAAIGDRGVAAETFEGRAYGTARNDDSVDSLPY